MKYWIYILIMVICVSAAYAGLALTREDAITELKVYKTERESIISRIVNNIKITSDKKCHVNYLTENIDYCTICFEYPFPGAFGNKVSECKNFPEDSDINQDKEEIRNYVKRKANADYPMEHFYYVKNNVEGTTIPIR